MGKKVVDAEGGFEKATDQNLPSVDAFMVAQYFASGCFLSPEMRNVKTAQSGRASYGDNAMGYVQLRRDEDAKWLCHVKAEMTPEHRVRIKGYPVHFLVDEDNGEILKVICEDCPASEDQCKHTVALIFWLFRRSESPATTAVACYWKKSTLSKVGSSLEPLAIEDWKPSKKVVVPSDQKEAFFNAATDFLATTNPSILASNTKEQTSYSIFHLMMKYVKTPEPHSGEGFIKFAQDEMEDAVCKSLADATVNQSKSSLWYQLRQFRMTASKVHEGSRCQTGDGAFKDSCMGAVKLDTKAMKRGRELEPKVLRVVRRKFKRPIGRKGVMLRKSHPIFGASPDGILDNKIVEVKCPISKKSFKTYFDESRKRPAEKYRTQMQVQMKFMDLKEGLFCVANPNFENNKKITIMNEVFDEQYCDDVMSRAQAYWVKYIYPCVYRACKPSATT